MPRRATATSFGATRGIDPVKAAKRVSAKAIAAGCDVRMVRQRMREAASRQLGVLEAIADGSLKSQFATLAGPCEVEPTAAERIRAIDTLAKYGIGTQHELTGDPDRPLTLQVAVIGGKKVTF